MRQRAGIARICFVLAAVLCYYFGVRSCFSMEKTGAAVIYLSASYPSRTAAEDILEDCQAGEDSVDVCFYWDGGLQSVKNENYGRSSKVLVAGLTGDASLYNWRGGALAQEDRTGCIIDRETALELFGSDNCTGSTVTLGENDYEIRRIVPWSQRIMLIHPTDKEVMYTRVFVRPRKGETLQNAGSRFLMSYGLSGSLVDDGWLAALAGAALLLFPAGLAAAFFKAVGDRRKAAGEHTREYWLWLGISVLAAGALLFFIYKNFSISSDWLPDKWSNFGFWPEKIAKERENLGLYLMLPKTVPQTEQIRKAAESLFCGIFALVFYIRGLLVQSRFKKEGINEKSMVET